MLWKVVKIAVIVSGTMLTLFFIGLVVMVTRPALLVGVDGSSLAYSLSGGLSGSSEGGSCSKADGAWRCSVHGPNATGSFDVDVNWMGCWKARSRNPAARQAGPDPRQAGPDQLSGCIQLGDVIQIESFD